MAKLQSKKKDNPKLEQRTLADGRISLYLDYYLGRTSETITDENGNPVLYKSGKMAGKPKIKVHHARRKESLNLYLTAKPRTPIEREQNNETLRLAERIRFEREQEMKEERQGYRLRRERRVNFFGYFKAYVDNYTKKDVRIMKAAFSRFVSFLNETPEYARLGKEITPQQLTKEMMEDFTEYLKARSRGGGAHCIYAHFKKVVNRALDEGLILKNPCKGIVIKYDGNVLRKDVLSLDEEKTLMATHYEHEKPNVRRAFIFCLYCGVRFCDVKDLTFANVDYANKLLRFEQNKTKGHSANSGVIIPLNEWLLRLVGKPADGQTMESVIFPLPCYSTCIKELRKWVEAAGIKKHITWHCARHSFAVNILNNGANIKTLASLLGHSGLNNTEKYTRAIDSLKQEAINSLPAIDIENI